MFGQTLAVEPDTMAIPANPATRSTGYSVPLVDIVISLSPGKSDT